MKEKTYEQKLRGNLMVLFAFFILTLIAGVYSIKYSYFIPFTLILLAFLIFNGLTIIIDLIIKSTRAIVNANS